MTGRRKLEVVIGIKEGKLKASTDKRCIHVELATEKGAQAMGTWLAGNGFFHWMYSSSVDFPTEYGAPNLDFRTLLEAELPPGEPA